MPRGAACLLVSSVLVTLAGFGGQATPINPGDRVGAMRVVKGTEATAHHKLFDTCDPVILRSGVYSRRCGSVPKVTRLFIGYGVFAPPREINQVWAPSTWRAWLDGRRIRLAAFDWSSRTLLRFPPAGGKDVTLREWRVMLLGATLGRHAIRYRFGGSAGWIDATWKFTVSAH